MTPTVLWALLPVTVIGGIVVWRFIAAHRAKAEHIRMLNESLLVVSVLCRLDGHLYMESKTGFRCGTCGSHLAREEAGIKHVATAGP